MASIGDLVAMLRLDASGFESGAEKGIKSTGHLHKEFEKHADMMRDKAFETAGAITSAFGIGFGVEKFISGIEGQIEKVTELVHLSERTGIDLNNLRAQQYQAKRTGLEFETLEKSITKMQVNAAGAVGGGDKEKLFKQLGLDPEELSKMDPAEAFAKVGDAIGGLEDPTSRVHVAYELLGKTGAETLGVLLSGTKGLKDAQAKVGILNPEGVEEMHKAHEAMLDLDAASAKLARTAAADVAPGITKVADALANAAGWADHLANVKMNEKESFLGGFLGSLLFQGEPDEKQKSKSLFGGADSVYDASDITGVRDRAREKKAAADKKALFEKQMKEEEEYHKGLDDMAKEGERMANALETPYEKAVDEFDKAYDLFNNSAIDTDTFALAFIKMQTAAQDAKDKALKPLQEEWDKMSKQADSLLADAMTPLEKYQEKVAEINELWEAGALTEKEAAIALSAQADKLKAAQDKGHHEQPKQEHLEAFAVGSRESLQAFVEAFRGGGKDQIQEQQLQAQQTTAEAVATVAKNTDPDAVARLFPIWNIDGLGTS
ncbi:MAG TPA: hypothetical protein VFG04_08130 [Planctomycetaceae bacterium]|jgi:hypothetical protein|nr:hypothetical protein [Planctomycetaceae bacterium]